MLRTRHAFYLVLLIAPAAVVAVLPASAQAHHGQIPCMGAPDYVGHMGDAEGWFRYPVGRSAEHINAGTFTLAIDDTSSTENFRLSDLRSKRVRGRVVRQSPGAGCTLAVGARVNLVVSRGPRVEPPTPFWGIPAAGAAD